MSLLNDALRKKKSEHHPVGKPLGASPPEATSRRNRKQHWIIAGCSLVLFFAVFGTWLYWSGSDASSELTVSNPETVWAETDSEDHIGKPEDGDTISASATATSIKLPKPAAPPTRPSRKPANQAQPRPTQSKTRIAPVDAQAARRPEKKKRDAKTRKKPASQIRPAARSVAAKKSAAQSHLHSKRLYKKARQYHRRGRLEQAIALYQEVIKIDPEHFKARFNLSSAYLQTDSHTKAYYIISDLHQKDPTNQQVLLNLAIAHIGCNRYHEALDLLNSAAEQPEAPMFEIALHKGLAYSHLDQPQDAMMWYKRAEALRPADKRLLFNLAVVSDQQQNYESAINYYRKHLANSPNIDASKEKQIRQRIRTLQVYHAEKDLKE
jgi:tetratricopeptide (TPR) repeat protein